MLLALDVGNTQLFGGVLSQDSIVLRFRRTSRDQGSSDEYGLFLKNVLRENKISPEEIKAVVMSSVVPDMNHTIASACIKYFGLRPLILEAGIKTGLKILIYNPPELGADRVANAVGALELYKGRNLVVFDFGTANTACIISKNKEYMGGLIAAGMRLSMQVLEEQTAKLPTVQIRVPAVLFGKDTVEQIQAGLYYQVLGMVKEVVHAARQTFAEEQPLIIGTGGFSKVFEKAGIFDVIEPDLVLIGLKKILELNS